MGHLGVPWAVGGGATNDEVLARKLTYTMFGGGEGVTYSGACMIKALTVPDSFIRTSPGDYVVKARGVGQVRESYFGSVVSDDVVPITPTGGLARSDLVIARIEDAHVAGEPWTVDDPAVGPYAFTRIISNVPSTTTSVRQLGNNFSAITLARIDIPANTGAITTPMIKDLRSLVSPLTGSSPPPGTTDPEGGEVYHETERLWTDTVIAPGAPFSEKLTNTHGLAFGSPGPWYQFPSAANWLVPVPWWATGVDVLILLNNMRFDEDIWGQMRINMCNIVVSSNQEYDVNYQGGPGPERMPFILSATMPIPAELRGKVGRFKVETRLLAGSPSHTGRLEYLYETSLYTSMNFKQFPAFD